MKYAAAAFGLLGVGLLLCGSLLVLVTTGEDRSFSKRIAAWGILCLMGMAICLLLAGAGL
jgi:hypothetical protein